MRVVCLISGSGSNLQALIDWQVGGQLGQAKIVGVIANRRDAGGLKRAESAAIETHIIEHTHYPDRESFDRALIDVIDPLQPDLVILAGFMRILSASFVAHYAGQLINIHPSLLPKYKGLNTHQRALASGDQTAGATVHWVTAALDAGEIIRQVEVPIHPDDTEESLKARVLEAEHSLYPAVVRDLSLGVISPCDA
jgi:phosphoribosylglycinamide formyltransferase-1